MIAEIGKKYNDILVYVSTFLFSAAFTLPIWTFYFTEYLEISLTQATFVWTLSSFAALLFEIPTWAWSDRYGRKKIALWGLFVIFLTSLTYLWARDVWIFVINAFVNGFGSALVSWCIVWMIYDRYKERQQEDNYARFVSYKSVVWFISRAIAALFAGWLYSFHPLLPFGLVSLCLVLNLIVIMYLYDPPHAQSVASNSWQHIVDGIWYIRSHQGIMYVLFFMIGGFAASDMMWSLYQSLSSSWWVSKEIISYLYILIGACSAFWSRFAGRLSHRWSTARRIIVTLCIGIFSAMVLLYDNVYVRLLAMIPLWCSFGFYVTVVSSYINKHIPSSHRVTINSIEWFLYSWVYFVMAGSAWWLYDVFGEQGVLWINVAVPSFFLLLYVLLSRAPLLYDVEQ